MLIYHFPLDHFHNYFKLSNSHFFPFIFVFLDYPCKKWCNFTIVFLHVLWISLWNFSLGIYWLFLKVINSSFPLFLNAYINTILQMTRGSLETQYDMQTSLSDLPTQSHYYTLSLFKCGYPICVSFYSFKNILYVSCSDPNSILAFHFTFITFFNPLAQYIFCIFHELFSLKIFLFITNFVLVQIKDYKS